jgi:hypothetical protein
MGTPVDVEAIKSQASSQYGIDLGSLANAEKQLKEISEHPDQIESKQIYAASTTFSDDSLALVPDLETFAYADVGSDPRLYPRRIEQNLDEAIRYVQICLQLRQYYSDTAKLRNDTRFKGEEFVRLDSVHIEEVTAGLYKLPWMEAFEDGQALQKAIAETTNQQNVVDAMKKAGPLSPTSITDFISGSAQLARDSSGNSPQEVYKGAKATTTYRTEIESATWDQALAAIKASLEQLNGKLKIAQFREVYLRKDEGFRAHRAAISRYLAYLQLAEHCRSNSAINYAQRLDHQKALFQSNLIALIQRVNSLLAGLKNIYGVDVAFKAPETGKMLDDLSVWIAEVQNELSKVKRTHRLIVASVWTSNLKVTPRPDATSLDTFEADITVNGTGLPPKPKLRGVAFEYTGQHGRPLVLNVLPPPGAYDAVNTGGGPDKLQFGRVCQFSPAAELRPQHADVFWNGSAWGAWHIEGAFDQGLGALDAVVMHLWMATAA